MPEPTPLYQVTVKDTFVCASTLFIPTQIYLVTPDVYDNGMDTIGGLFKDHCVTAVQIYQ